MRLDVTVYVLGSLGPRPKPTPARIASSIMRGVILEAIRAEVGLGLGPRLCVVVHSVLKTAILDLGPVKYCRQICPRCAICACDINKTSKYLLVHVDIWVIQGIIILEARTLSQ